MAFSSEILETIPKKENLSFIASRDEIKFQNIENEISRDYSLPFYLPNMYLQSPISILVHEAMGLAHLDLIDKIRLLTHIYEGKMIYQKINEDSWQVVINF